MNWELVALFLLACICMDAFLQAYRKGKLTKRQFAVCLTFTIGFIIVPMIIFGQWRDGEVVARARFDPGVAPFTIEVRKVPVPVTRSSHFIVSLNRGEYVVTSFRFFWPEFTPSSVKIVWPCMNHFTVIFDDVYKADCEWAWGTGAKWTLTGPKDGNKAGLGEYYYIPRNKAPASCPAPHVYPE